MLKNPPILASKMMESVRLPPYTWLFANNAQWETFKQLKVKRGAQLRKCFRDTWTVPNSSELSSIDVPTKSKDKHLSARESASSCNRLATAYFISHKNHQQKITWKYEKDKNRESRRREGTQIKRLANIECYHQFSGDAVMLKIFGIFEKVTDPWRNRLLFDDVLMATPD